LDLNPHLSHSGKSFQGVLAQLVKDGQLVLEKKARDKTAISPAQIATILEAERQSAVTLFEFGPAPGTDRSPVKLSEHQEKIDVLSQQLELLTVQLEPADAKDRADTLLQRSAVSSPGGLKAVLLAQFRLALEAKFEEEDDVELGIAPTEQPLTPLEKRQLSLSIHRLPDDKMTKVVQVILKRVPIFDGGDTKDLEITKTLLSHYQIDALSTKTLRHLQLLCKMPLPAMRLCTTAKRARTIDTVSQETTAPSVLGIPAETFVPLETMKKASGTFVFDNPTFPQSTTTEVWKRGGDLTSSFTATAPSARKTERRSRMKREKALALSKKSHMAICALEIFFSHWCLAPLYCTADGDESKVSLSTKELDKIAPMIQGAVGSIWECEGAAAQCGVNRLLEKSEKGLVLQVLYGPCYKKTYTMSIANCINTSQRRLVAGVDLWQQRFAWQEAFYPENPFAQKTSSELEGVFAVAHLLRMPSRQVKLLVQQHIKQEILLVKPIMDANEGSCWKVLWPFEMETLEMEVFKSKLDENGSLFHQNHLTCFSFEDEHDMGFFTFKIVENKPSSTQILIDIQRVDFDEEDPDLSPQSTPYFKQSGQTSLFFVDRAFFFRVESFSLTPTEARRLQVGPCENCFGELDDGYVITESEGVKCSACFTGFTCHGCSKSYEEDDDITQCASCQLCMECTEPAITDGVVATECVDCKRDYRCDDCCSCCGYDSDGYDSCGY
jgi:hypothetical protein